MVANPPVDVQRYGQSIWYDNIRRGLISSGELSGLIAHYGVLGITSNPSIFQKAIGESDDYDAAMSPLLELSPYEIYEKLAIEDIQMALDLLRPIYDRTNGRDGYVSLEVSPLIAHDTETTLAEAKRLFALLDRPNAMIKIPATEAGLPAIEAAIAAGININVTLIFSVENYEAVAEAYIKGLEQRLAVGLPVTQIASVASFFLSRIDTIVDRMLENNIRSAQGRDIDRVSANRKLLGKAAIANAQVAYQRFQKLFYGERFAALREAGAQVQRPLWASTGTKNPAYPDTLYLDSLIGRDTVNTVPPATLDAFKDHGTVSESLLNEIDEAEPTLKALADVGIDLAQITHQLQVDGVEAFSESFENLLDQVDAKRNVLKTGVMRQQEMVLSIYKDAIEAALNDIDKRFINVRIWEQEASIWNSHNPVINEIKNRLGWLEVQKTTDLERLQGLQHKAKAWDAVVLLGIGSSAFAPIALANSFGPQAGFPRLHVLDSIAPARIQEVEAGLDISKTLFIVSSKSGKTLETQCLFKYFYAKTGENGQQFLAVTDPESPLAQLAAEKGFMDTFLNPPDIGGRYSPLSYPGMVPAALMGLDLKRFWASVERMIMACGPNVASANHPAIILGVAMGTLANEGRDKVSLFCSPSISDFANWVEHSLAESTGKDGKGLIPVVGATVGNPHDYMTDRQFVYLRVDGDDNDALDQGMLALQQAGHVCITLRLDDVYALAGEFFRWQFATAVAGIILEINPFDEPNIRESHRNALKVLGNQDSELCQKAAEPVLTENGVSLYVDEKLLNLLSELSLQHQYSGSDLTGLLAAQINSTRAGDYFALLVYLAPLPETNETLEMLRRRLRHTTGRAVTIGYGPRYLHSTGQLHKGGPNQGIYLMITHDDPVDIPIPDETFTFGQMKAAQAIGDMEALIQQGRRVIRLHLGEDVAGGLNVLLNAIDTVHERRR
jgi:transaldolase/glucose-6-phosphate isomerase